MTEIEHIKQALKELADETNGPTETRNAYKKISLLSHEWLASLVAIIESQNEEIARHQEREFNHYPREILELETRIFKLQDDTDSQKDITELAVKALESISNGYYGAAECKAFSIGILREIRSMK